MAYRDEAERLNGVLAGALGQLAKKGQPSALQALWAEAAGPQAAQASRPVNFQSGTLTIEVDTPPWLDALRGQGEALTGRLRASLPGCYRVELRLRGTR
jgi:predicted nucleic acid-binding Zn ribbon protein